MDNALRLEYYIPEDLIEDDPFYSKENVEAILKAKAQLERGEGIEFEIDETN